MQANLWAPGPSLSKNSGGRHQLNVMCDLTQFFVSAIIIEACAEHPAKIFMENVVFLFGMVPILIIDSDSWFKSVFADMCTAVGIIYWPFACGNYKILRFEKY